MNTPHKRVLTSHPVAIKCGQESLHVGNPIPDHRHCERVQCPDCDTLFIVDANFPKVQLLEVLNKQHTNKEKHPDYVASVPEFTCISDCNCGA